MKKNSEIPFTQISNKVLLLNTLENQMKNFLEREKEGQIISIQMAGDINTFKILASRQIERINLLLINLVVAINKPEGRKKIFEYLEYCEEQHALVNNRRVLQIFPHSSLMFNEESIDYQLERQLRQNQLTRSSLAHLKDELAFFKQSEKTFDEYLNNLPSGEEKISWLVLKERANFATAIVDTQIKFLEKNLEKSIESYQPYTISKKSTDTLDSTVFESLATIIQNGLKTIAEEQQRDKIDQLLNHKKRKTEDLTGKNEAYSTCFFMRSKRLRKGELLDLLITSWNVPEGSFSNGEYLYDEPSLRSY